MRLKLGFIDIGLMGKLMVLRLLAAQGKGQKDPAVLVELLAGKY